MTDYFLGTATETSTVTSFVTTAPALLFEADSEVTVSVTTNDMLSARGTLEPDGSRYVDLTTATLESGEPNTAGFTKTIWFELPLDVESRISERIQVTSATSTAKVVVYKQSSLDDVLDYGDLTDEEQADTDPLLSEPSLSELERVQVGSADQVFTLDLDYGSSYFLQVGVTSGTGNDVFLVWSDGEPSIGGSYNDPVVATGPAGLASVSTANAWLEDGDPNSFGITETRSVWIQWEAPSTLTTPVNFKVSGDGTTPFSAEVYTLNGIWDPDTTPSFTLVTSELSSDGSEVVLETDPSPGDVYYIRVATTKDPLTFRIAWTAPVYEHPAAEPVESILVTVHAGAGGGTWGGVTYAPNEMITELPNRVGVQFQESLNVAGSGSVTLLQNDAIIRAFNPATWPTKDDDSWSSSTQTTWSEDPFQLLRFGNIIKFWMYHSDLEETRCVSAFIIKARDINVVGSSEAADRTITVSGPTVHQLFNDFMVVHDNYPKTRTSDSRPYNWHSIVAPEDLIENGGWFDKTGTYLTNPLAWNNPINSSAFTHPPGYRKKSTESYSSRPKYALTLATPKWPDRSAQWMWMNGSRTHNQDTNFPPPGKTASTYHYYKAKNFNITTGGARYRFSAYSDTRYRVYLDGEQIMTHNANEHYKVFQKKTVTLDASSSTNVHDVTIYVQDTPTKDYDHNDAFLFTVQQLNSKGAVVKTILRSNKTSWYAWHGTQQPPSWSNASIFASVIKEAKLRGNDSANMLTLRNDFGSKSEEGNYWYDNKTRNVSIQVGMSGLDLAAQFSETNRMDIAVDPDTLEVRAWQGSTNGEFPRGVDRSKSVALVPGYNLVNWSVNESDDVKNTLLVQYDGGYVVVTADVASGNYESIQKYGKREGYLELGGLGDSASAIDMAKSILTFVGSEDSVSGSSDIVGHQTESYNGSVIPVRGAVPFLDWEVGDTVSAPASNSVLRPHRVLSITCTEDENGNLTFDPELQGV